MFEEDPPRVYVARSGLIQGEGLADHNTVFSVDRTSFELAPGEDSLVVRLQAPATPYAKVVKTYTFHRSSYVVDVSFEVTNLASAPAEPYAYFQLVRDIKPARGRFQIGAYLHRRRGLHGERQAPQDQSSPTSRRTRARIRRARPTAGSRSCSTISSAPGCCRKATPRDYFLKPLTAGLVAGGVITPVGKIEPKQSAKVEAKLYAGPQEQERLKALAPGLELTIDYGWLRVLAVPLFWVLNEIHSVVGNWGVAIIILTVLIKLVFYPLSAASYKSMAQMKVLAPKLQRLKERFGDDRQKMHEAMIELYKTEKINPLGGCLPIVVQIPVFIALYWVLLLSVELRHAPFMLWINDLSAPDPYFILPVLMGATMFIQTWLNPTPPDPMQAKLMKIMPIAFSVFFFFFPSGLVLYWLVNNILSIGQQWQITRTLERSKAAHGGT